MNFRSTMAAALMVGAMFSVQAETMTFDTPVVTGPSQAPGVWYTDRYAPAGFQTSGGTLVQSISAADSGDNRPGSFSAPFYNTQGRKYDLTTSTTAISIDLFVDASWTDASRRYAGIWGTGFDAANAVSAYPILEYGLGGFRYYDTNTGIYSSSVATTTNAFHTLSIELVGGNFEYEIDGILLGVSAAPTSQYIGNVILQGHNTQAGVTYDISWDNLTFNGAQAVPEPGSMALVALSLFGLMVARRRSA